MMTDEFERELIYEMRRIRENTEYLRYLTFLEHMEADLTSISNEMAGIVNSLQSIVEFLHNGVLSVYAEIDEDFYHEIQRIREHLWYISRRLYEIRNRLGGGKR